MKLLQYNDLCWVFEVFNDVTVCSYLNLTNDLHINQNK